MERLTIRNSDGSVSQPTDLRWAEALERLADYEDTKLMPADIEAVIKALDPIPFSRFRKLMEAARAGRALTLSCKVGQTVYFPLLNRIVEEKVVRIVVDPVCVTYHCGGISQFQFKPSDIGEMVFLTWAEAENKHNSWEYRSWEDNENKGEK